MGQRPTYEDENGFYSATSLSGSAALPFVISTGAERSLCGCLFLEMFSTEDSWARGPPKVMKKASVRQLLSIEPLPFPLSSRAYPDFLLHSSNQGHLCGSP